MRAAGEICWPLLMTLTGNRMGIFDVPCPLCSHLRKPANRKNPCCASGITSGRTLAASVASTATQTAMPHSDSPWARRIDRKQLALMMREADKAKVERDNRMRRQRSICGAVHSIANTPAERYLRSRGITCPLPAPLRFLPASGPHPPAMVAPFGVPAERESLANSIPQG